MQQYTIKCAIRKNTYIDCFYGLCFIVTVHHNIRDNFIWRDFLAFIYTFLVFAFWWNLRLKQRKKFPDQIDVDYFMCVLYLFGVYSCRNNKHTGRTKSFVFDGVLCNWQILSSDRFATLCHYFLFAFGRFVSLSLSLSSFAPSLSPSLFISCCGNIWYDKL